MPTPEEARSLARRFMDEVLTQRNIDLIDELCAEDYEIEAPRISPSTPQRQTGHEVIKERLALVRSIFPDSRFIVQDIISNGTLVCAKVEFTGTHTRPFAGFEPTHRKVSLLGIRYMLLDERGRIKRSWEGFCNIAEALAPPGEQP